MIKDTLVFAQLSGLFPTSLYTDGIRLDVDSDIWWRLVPKEHPFPLVHVMRGALWGWYDI